MQPSSTPTSSGESRRLAHVVHILAILAGALTIFATSAPALGLPIEVAQAVGVLVAVLMYIANQLPALGAD